MRFDLAVVGGGIMGLACALEETGRGKRVAVIDPNPPGRKASWAAAGILAARAGLLGNSPLREMYLRSLYGYREWVARVESAAGMAIPYEREGDYQIFPLDQSQSRNALARRERQLIRDRAGGFTVSDELPDFLRTHSPLKNVRVFFFPGEARVRNRVLLEALEAALRKRGTEFVLGRPASWSVDGGESVLAGEGWSVRAGQALVTAGAWSDEVLGLRGISVPMRPVKGQLGLLPNFHGQGCMIHCGEELYLIPRGDQLIVGSTTEPGVWEEGFNDQGASFLREKLWTYFPGVKTEWTETWSGLRPRSLDRLPLMGWADEKSKIAICAGHYKTGISLAPLAAQCVSALLCGEKPPANLRAFDPWRPSALGTRV